MSKRLKVSTLMEMVGELAERHNDLDMRPVWKRLYNILQGCYKEEISQDEYSSFYRRACLLAYAKTLILEEDEKAKEGTGSSNNQAG